MIFLPFTTLCGSVKMFEDPNLVIGCHEFCHILGQDQGICDLFVYWKSISSISAARRICRPPEVGNISPSTPLTVNIANLKRKRESTQTSGRLTGQCYISHQHYQQERFLLLHLLIICYVLSISWGLKHKDSLINLAKLIKLL